MTCPKLLSKTVHHIESHFTSLAFTPTCLRSISSCPSPSNYSSIGTPWICIYYYIYFQSVPFNLVMHHLMRHFSRIQKNLNDYNQCVWIVFLQKLWKICLKWTLTDAIATCVHYQLTMFKCCSECWQYPFQTKLPHCLKEHKKSFRFFCILEKLLIKEVFN